MSFWNNQIKEGDRTSIRSPLMSYIIRESKMGIIRLNNEEIDLLEEFKNLPLSDRINVSGLVCDLFKILQSENRPSRETIATII